MPRQNKSSLPAGISLTKETTKKGTIFRVRLGKKYTGVEPIRKAFVKRSEALQWVKGSAHTKAVSAPGIIELRKSHGTKAFELSNSEYLEAAAATKRCKAVGMSITEAVDIALRHGRTEAGPISADEALVRMTTEKRIDGISEKHLNEMGKKIRRFLGTLPKTKRNDLGSITTLDIRNYITATATSDGNRKAIKRNLSPLFTWAVDQSHIPANPCTELQVGRRRGSSQKIAIRPTGEQVRVVTFYVSELRLALQRAHNGTTLRAPADDEGSFHARMGSKSFNLPPGDLVPWLVLGCFAGLRPEEAEIVDWCEINFERNHIDLPAHKAKDRQQRIIPMETVLRDWLKPIAQLSGSIIPRNFRRKRRALCLALGWKEWPRDITRHSYGTYHLALYKKAGDTAENMGHANPRTLRKFYRDVVRDPNDIPRYWALTPEAISRPTPGTEK